MKNTNQEIKDQLSLRREIYRTAGEGLNLLLDILNKHNYKAITTRLKTEVSALNQSDKWKRSYYAMIDKSYLNKFHFNLYYTVNGYHEKIEEIFYFGSADEFTVENLKLHVQHRLEGIAEQIGSIEADMKTIDDAIKIYERAKNTLDTMRDVVSFYTWDLITAENKYEIKKY